MKSKILYFLMGVLLPINIALAMDREEEQANSSPHYSSKISHLPRGTLKIKLTFFFSGKLGSCPIDLEYEKDEKGSDTLIYSNYKEFYDLVKGEIASLTEKKSMSKNLNMEEKKMTISKMANGKEINDHNFEKFKTTFFQETQDLGLFVTIEKDKVKTPSFFKCFTAQTPREPTD